MYDVHGPPESLNRGKSDDAKTNGANVKYVPNNTYADAKLNISLGGSRRWRAGMAVYIVFPHGRSRNPQ